jgi:hypothetical protein
MTEHIVLQYKLHNNKCIDNKPANALSEIGHVFKVQAFL